MRVKIERALSRSVCSGWDRRFLESILEQTAKGRELSVKQKQTIGKVLARNGEDAERAHAEWETTFREQYEHDGKILAWYHSHQPYYKPMATDILSGKVPQRTKFLQMYDNKYSKKVLTQAHAKPLYAPGDYVRPRTTFNTYKHAEFPMDMVWTQQNKVIEMLRQKGGFVIEVCDGIRSAAKGAKRYRLLPIGCTTPVIVEERFLKKAKKQ